MPRLLFFSPLSLASMYRCEEIAHQFMNPHVIADPTQTWRRQLEWDPDASPLYARGPFSGIMSDNSITKFADDIAKRYCLFAPRNRCLEWKAGRANR